MKYTSMYRCSLGLFILCVSSIKIPIKSGSSPFKNAVYRQFNATFSSFKLSIAHRNSSRGDVKHGHVRTQVNYLNEANIPPVTGHKLSNTDHKCFGY